MTSIVDKFLAWPLLVVGVLLLIPIGSCAGFYTLYALNEILTLFEMMITEVDPARIPSRLGLISYGAGLLISFYAAWLVRIGWRVVVGPRASPLRSPRERLKSACFLFAAWLVSLITFFYLLFGPIGSAVEHYYYPSADDGLTLVVNFGFGILLVLLSVWLIRKGLGRRSPPDPLS